MAATYSPTGKEPDTCETACAHKDCAANRELIAHVCEHCNEPIGTGVRWYVGVSAKPVHARCIER